MGDEPVACFIDPNRAQQLGYACMAQVTPMLTPDSRGEAQFLDCEEDEDELVLAGTNVYVAQSAEENLEVQFDEATKRLLRTARTCLQQAMEIFSKPWKPYSYQ